MSTKVLDGKDAVIVTLAMQRKTAMERQALDEFSAAVALVASDLGAPDGTAISFNVAQGVATATWPDASAEQAPTV